jgi:hypothetical protein
MSHTIALPMDNFWKMLQVLGYKFYEAREILWIQIRALLEHNLTLKTLSS